jgi:hypothetical protein
VGTATIALAVCLATSSSESQAAIVTDSVDLIEINHCYDEQGQLVFDQVLFYDWCAEKGRYDVRDWRLLKRRIQIPRRHHDTGTYVAVWRDGQTLRKVHAQTIRESWTQYDPEIVEQNHLPKNRRRALTKLTVWQKSRRPRDRYSPTGRTARQSRQSTQTR